MTCRVLLFSVIKDAVGAEQMVVPLEAGTTVGQLFDALCVKFPTLEKWRSTLLMAVNQEYVKATALIPADAEVAFMPPVQGG